MLPAATLDKAGVHAVYLDSLPARRPEYGAAFGDATCPTMSTCSSWRLPVLIDCLFRTVGFGVDKAEAWG